MDAKYRNSNPKRNHLATIFHVGLQQFISRSDLSEISVSRHDEKLPSISLEHQIVLQFRGMNEKVRCLRFRVKTDPSWCHIVSLFLVLLQ